MKIRYWTPYMGNIGTIKATINSAAALKKLGHDVAIYRIYHEWEGYEDVIASCGIDIIDFELSKKFKKLPSFGVGYRFSMILLSIFAFSYLKRDFQREKPDVVIASILGYLPLLVRKFSKQKPKIVNSIQGKPKLHAVRKILWKILYSESDLLITLSDETQKEIAEKLHFPVELVQRVDNAVIDDRIDQMMAETIDEPEKKGAFLLGVGRLTRQKDFTTLIKAVNIVRRKKEVHLLILGEGEERKKLEQLIEDLDMTEVVELKGFVQNPYKYMHRADVFVLSSLWEDAGHVLLEAAYTRTPIVSTRCPNGQEEFLDYGKAGELCEVGDVKGMADAILKVLNRENDDKIERAYKKSLSFKQEVHGENLMRAINTLFSVP